MVNKHLVNKNFHNKTFLWKGEWPRAWISQLALIVTFWRVRPSNIYFSPVTRIPFWEQRGACKSALGNARYTDTLWNWSTVRVCFWVWVTSCLHHSSMLSPQRRQEKGSRWRQRNNERSIEKVGEKASVSATLKRTWYHLCQDNLW